MRKLSVLLVFSLFLSSHISAQESISDHANNLFVEGKYSAAQALFQQAISNYFSDEYAHYYLNQ